MQAIINIKYQDRAFQAMLLGIQPKDFPDAFHRCALAFIGTTGGIQAMKALHKKSLDFDEAFDAMPQQLCVMYGFMPIRGSIPEIDMDCENDGPVATLSQCIPNKSLITAACALAADGPRGPYEKIMGAMHIPNAYCDDRDQRAWQIMRAVESYGKTVKPYSGALPHSVYEAMAEILYDNAGTLQKEDDTEE